MTCLGRLKRIKGRIAAYQARLSAFCIGNRRCNATRWPPRAKAAGLLEQSPGGLELRRLTFQQRFGVEALAGTWIIKTVCSGEDNRLKARLQGVFLTWTSLWLTLLLSVACTASPGPVATPYPTLPRPLPTLTPGPPRQAEFFPSERPVAARGAQPYATLCESCHGPDGKGDTALGRTLSPRPSNFHDVEFLRRRTPSSLYRSISKGVLGTAMLAYEGQLNEMQRWDVWAYSWTFHVKPEDIQMGSRLYAANCATCHGAQGEGGTGTALGDPRLLAGRTGHGMFNAISSGLAPAPDHQWTNLSEANRWAIIEYIWTFMYDRE